MIDFENFNENISDEMLAAYIDGKTSFMENSIIEDSLSKDSQLSEAVEISKDCASLDNNLDWDLYQDNSMPGEKEQFPCFTGIDIDAVTNDILNNEEPFRTDVLENYEYDFGETDSDSFLENENSIDENTCDHEIGDEYSTSEDYGIDF